MSSRNSRARQGASPMILFLLFQIYSQIEKLPVKPPVTIALLFVNVFTHLTNVDILGYNLSNISQNCIHPSKIIQSILNNRSILLNRLVFSSLIHVDDMHLYYNMLSLLWKGINLETGKK